MSKMSKLPRRSVTNVHAADELVELENHFILRLPPETAEKVRNWLQEGDAAFKDKMYIQFQPDMRHAQVKVEKETFSGKLVDLPCVIETLKTLDKKTFYKVTDVAQMLACCADADDEHKEDQKTLRKLEEFSKDPKKKDKQYHWPHGITPPLKNVRKRRFRKTLKKKYMDAPELEKELKRLLREDMEAVNVRWEIVTAEQEMEQKLKAQKQKSQQQVGHEGASTVQQSSEQPISRVDELFGGALTSSSDEEPSEIEQIPDSDAENDVTISSAGAGTPRMQQEIESLNNTLEDLEETEGVD